MVKIIRKQQRKRVKMIKTIFITILIFSQSAIAQTNVHKLLQLNKDIDDLFIEVQTQIIDLMRFDDVESEAHKYMLEELTRIYDYKSDINYYIVILHLHSTYLKSTNDTSLASLVEKTRNSIIYKIKVTDDMIGILDKFRRYEPSLMLRRTREKAKELLNRMKRVINSIPIDDCFIEITTIQEEKQSRKE